MVTKPLYKLLLGVYLTILAIFTLHSAYGQMPPSPRLLEKLRRGEIEVPYQEGRIRIVPAHPGGERPTEHHGRKPDAVGP